jgi:hypothetical protein
MGSVSILVDNAWRRITRRHHRWITEPGPSGFIRGTNSQGFGDGGFALGGAATAFTLETLHVCLLTAG